MKKIYFLLFIASTLGAGAQTPYYDQTREGFLVFYPIQKDAAGNIISWYSAEPGVAFDFVINAVWNFWDTMRHDINGLPYYMNHQVWRPLNDPRGVGGDQFAMALSSWALLYQYNGNEKVKENMKFIADYYLTHSLSPATAKWPHLPFPYNTFIYSGIYDGDMVIGKGYTQPDKAGSFGIELVKLYKITGNDNYLDAAIAIANTLAAQTKVGDYNNSPLPFKVNAFTGAVGQLKSNSGNGAVDGTSGYTTNWSGTMELFMELQKMKMGNTVAYNKAFTTLLAWMKKYPLQNNRWGPFFEDIPGWSDTQINAVTFARFMMEHKELFENWQQDVKKIFDWVYQKLGNNSWQSYGVKVVNEQTAYQTPGNSHTSRQAAATLLYGVLSGDTTQQQMAIRQLLWATYMVDRDGKNNYPRDEVWLTDGYGDYVRHYLNSMAVMPQLAPNQNHILHTTSVITQADYPPNFNKRLVEDVKTSELDKVVLFYKTYDVSSTETVRMTNKPSSVTVDNKTLAEVSDKNKEGWHWQPLQSGGVLYIKHQKGKTVRVFK